MTTTIKFKESQGIAQVILARPQVKNAFSEEMIAELTNCFLSLEKRNDLRVIELTAEGNQFCAGADLNWMKKMAGFSYEQNQADAGMLFDMFGAIRNCSIPVVACVKGGVYGGGLGLLAAADFVLADEASKFCFSEVKLGLVPAVISSFVLEKCPLGFAMPKMLSGMLFSASEAQQMGLVHQIAEADKVDAELAKIIKNFMALGPEATRETKRLIQKTRLDDWNLRRSLSSKVIAERRASPEGQEGLMSFLESRSPSWSRR